jgi:DNA-binding transcriptional ArsR family regulator
MNKTNSLRCARQACRHLTFVLNENMDELTETFSALADPTRRAIIARLAAGDATVGELARPFDISGPAISRHLRVLEEAQLIERKVQARWRVCSLRRDRLAAAERWIEQVRSFWEAAFDRIEGLLATKVEEAKGRKGR